MKKELSNDVYEHVLKYSAKGDALIAETSYTEAVGEYNKAWDIIPEPKHEWDAATWVLAGIVDACFLGGFKNSAFDALQNAFICPGAIGNPFLHLRHGQVLFDRGEFDKAADELMRAYMGDGEKAFELEDAKYLNFLKARIDT